MSSVLTLALVATMAPAGSAFYAKPYLNLGDDDGRARTKSLTVVWHTTTAPQGWKVTYRSESRRESSAEIAFREVAVGGVPRHWIMRAVLAGLRPGEAVKYTVARGSESFASAARAPKSADQPWTMAVMGDTGRGTPGQRQITFQLHQSRPDLVMVPGDIVYPRGRMSEYQQFFFPTTNADRAGRAAGAPSMRSTLWVGVTGNHDTAYRDLNANPDGLAFYAYWLQPRNGPAFSPRVSGNAKGLQAASGDAWGRGGNFSFHYGNAAIIALDANTYAPWKSGALRAWLEGELKSAKAMKWRIVCFHQPPYHSSTKKKDETYMQTIAPLLSKYGVDLVLNGHVHNYQRTYPLSFEGLQLKIDRAFDGKSRMAARGPIYVVTGAGGAELYDQQFADKPATWKPWTAAYKKGYSFSHLSIDGGALTFKQVGVDGSVLDQFRLTK